MTAPEVHKKCHGVGKVLCHTTFSFFRPSLPHHLLILLSFSTFVINNNSLNATTPTSTQLLPHSPLFIQTFPSPSSHSFSFLSSFPFFHSQSIKKQAKTAYSHRHHGQHRKSCSRGYSSGRLYCRVRDWPRILCNCLQRPPQGESTRRVEATVLTFLVSFLQLRSLGLGNLASSQSIGVVHCNAINFSSMDQLTPNSFLSYH